MGFDLRPALANFLDLFIRRYAEFLKETCVCLCAIVFSTHTYLPQATYIQTGRQTDRQTGRKTDRQAYLQINIHACILAFTRTYIHIHVHTYVHTFIDSNI